MKIAHTRTDIGLVFLLTMEEYNHVGTTNISINFPKTSDPNQFAIIGPAKPGDEYQRQPSFNKTSRVSHPWKFTSPKGLKPDGIEEFGAEEVKVKFDQNNRLIIKRPTMEKGVMRKHQPSRPRGPAKPASKSKQNLDALFQAVNTINQFRDELGDSMTMDITSAGYVDVLLRVGR